MILGFKPRIDPLYQEIGSGDGFSSGSGIGDSFDRGAYFNTIEALNRRASLKNIRNANNVSDEDLEALKNTGLWDIEELERIRQARNSPMLTIDQANEKYGTDTFKIDRAMTEAEAKYLRQEHIKRTVVNERLSRADGGVFNIVGRFMAGMAASVTDPIEMGLNFLPAAGLLRKAGYLKNAGRFKSGAVDATAGTLLSRPIVAFQSSEEYSDYGLLDVMQDLAFGVVVGGGIPAVAGKISDWRAARRARKMNVEVEDVLREEPKIDFDITDEASLNRAVDQVTANYPARAIVKKADPEITRGAMGQMLERQQVDVADIAIIKESIKLRDLEDKVGDFDLYRSMSKENANVTKIKDGTYTASIDNVQTEVRTSSKLLSEDDPKEIINDLAEIIKRYEPVARQKTPTGLNRFRYVIKDGDNLVDIKINEKKLADGTIKREIDVSPAEKEVGISVARNYKIPATRITNEEIKSAFNNYVAKIRKVLLPDTNKELTDMRKSLSPNENAIKQEIIENDELITMLEQQQVNLTPQEKAYLADIEELPKQVEQYGKLGQAAATCIIGAL